MALAKRPRPSPLPPPLTLRATLIRLKRLINDLDDLIVELERDDPRRVRRLPKRTVH